MNLPMVSRSLLLGLALTLAGSACRRAEPGPAESTDQAAARIFATAQQLEQEHKTKQAFAAYRQVVDHFPFTPFAAKAAGRIKQAHASAARGKK